MTFSTTVLGSYLAVVLVVALVATVATLGTATAAVVRTRRLRLARRESLRVFYGPRHGSRYALHH